MLLMHLHILGGQLGDGILEWAFWDVILRDVILKNEALSMIPFFSRISLKFCGTTLALVCVQYKRLRGGHMQAILLALSLTILACYVF